MFWGVYVPYNFSIICSNRNFRFCINIAYVMLIRSCSPLTCHITGSFKSALQVVFFFFSMIKSCVLLHSFQCMMRLTTWFMSWVTCFQSVLVLIFYDTSTSPLNKLGLAVVMGASTACKRFFDTVRMILRHVTARLSFASAPCSLQPISPSLLLHIRIFNFPRPNLLLLKAMHLIRTKFKTLSSCARGLKSLNFACSWATSR